MSDKPTSGIIRMADDYGTTAKIKVIGVGGAGGNAVNRMVRNGFTGVEFIAINTDKMALENSLADTKIGLGGDLTRGLGAGARPEIGRQAIMESREEVAKALEGADMLFITAGMGGGTGTGAAPVVAEIARDMGILTVAVVTNPFLFEGPVRSRNARAGVETICQTVDTIIVIQNQKLLSVTPRKMQLNEAFKIADDVLGNAVQGICDIILKHGQIQVDFADVKTVMERGGSALMGTGIAEGEGRATAAAERAIHSPLLDEIDISGATSVLVNVTHGTDFGLHELDEAMHYIYEAVGEENQPNIIFGEVEDTSEAMLGKVSITVIATGFAPIASATPAPVAQKPVAPAPTPAPQVAVAPVAPVAMAYEAPTVAAPKVIEEDYEPSFMNDTAPMQSYSAPSYASVTAPIAETVIMKKPVQVVQSANTISPDWKSAAREEELRRPQSFMTSNPEPRATVQSNYEASMDSMEPVNTRRIETGNTSRLPAHHESENLDVPAYLRNGV